MWTLICMSDRNRKLTDNLFMTTTGCMSIYDISRSCPNSFGDVERRNTNENPKKEHHWRFLRSPQISPILQYCTRSIGALLNRNQSSLLPQPSRKCLVNSDQAALESLPRARKAVRTEEPLQNVVRQSGIPEARSPHTPVRNTDRRRWKTPPPPKDIPDIDDSHIGNAGSLHDGTHHSHRSAPLLAQSDPERRIPRGTEHVA